MFDFHFSNIYVSKLVYFHFIAHLIIICHWWKWKYYAHWRVCEYSVKFIRYIWLNISNRHVKLLWTCIEAINLRNICVNYWFKHSIKFDIFCTLVFCAQFFFCCLFLVWSVFTFPYFFSILIQVIVAYVYTVCQVHNSYEWIAMVILIVQMNASCVCIVLHGLGLVQISN